MEFSISVCIPAYRQPGLLQRCLDSLLLQDLQPLEVILTDDSPDSSVEEVARSYAGRLPLQYHRNETALGSPGNWNAALSRATGDLLLLLHHDDYFTAPDGLRAYAGAFRADASLDAVSSKIVTRDTEGRQTTVARQKELLRDLKRHPQRIVAANLIGPPSLLMLRRSALALYDPAYIWLVDLECYLRLLESGRRFGYIDRHLITIALHPGQVTNTLINKPVVLREHMLIAQGRVDRLRSDHAVYDHYWRMLRNLGVRRLQDLADLGIAEEPVPEFVRRMLRWQGRIPAKVLRFGPFSRIYMELCFRSGK